MDFPPEIRTALLNLLLEAIKELIALIRHIVENLVKPISPDEIPAVG